MYLNKTTLIGNITKDIELKSLPSGIKMISFGLATNRIWKDKEGNKQESAEFHNIVAFGKQAEVIHQYCSKGDQLFIEGRLQTRSWEKEDGTKSYMTEIVLENFQFGNKIQKKEITQEKSIDDSVEEIKTPSEDVYDFDGRTLNPDDVPF
jgi:single-strand DNA-binding protein